MCVVHTIGLLGQRKLQERPSTVCAQPLWMSPGMTQVPGDTTHKMAGRERCQSSPLPTGHPNTGPPLHSHAESPLGLAGVQKLGAPPSYRSPSIVEYCCHAHTIDWARQANSTLLTEVDLCMELQRTAAHQILPLHSRISLYNPGGPATMQISTCQIISYAESCRNRNANGTSLYLSKY